VGWSDTESTWYVGHQRRVIYIMMSVEQSVEWELAGETEVVKENLPQCHFVHQKSRVTWPGLRTRATAIGSLSYGTATTDMLLSGLTCLSCHLVYTRWRFATWLPSPLMAIHFNGSEAKVSMERVCTWYCLRIHEVSRSYLPDICASAEDWSSE
jgi:hypothetical protein